MKCFNNTQSKGERGNERKKPTATTTENHIKKDKKEHMSQTPKKLAKKTINTGGKNTTQTKHIF